MLVVLLSLGIFINALVLCYVADLLMHVLNLVAKEPFTHRAYLGQLAGKILYKRPATYKVIAVSQRAEETLYEEAYAGMNEQKAMSTVFMYQQAPEVVRIAVYRNNILYRQWISPQLSANRTVGVIS